MKTKNKINSVFFIVIVIVMALTSQVFAGYSLPSQPAGLPSSLENAAINATSWLLGFIVLLAVLFIVWGGIKYVFSAGNEENAQAGKKTITYALIGLIVAGGSYAMIAVIVDDVTNIKEPIITSTAISPTSGPPGTTFTIIATITASAGVDIATTIVHIQNPDETDIDTVTLYDDGAHSDGAAGDNVYGNTWNSGAAPAGPYFVDISACDLLGNCNEEENI